MKYMPLPRIAALFPSVRARAMVPAFAALLLFPFAAMAIAPVVATSGGSAAFVAGDNVASTPVAVDPGLAVSDVDSPTLARATVAITGNFHAGEDVLLFANDGATMGNIVASYDSATGAMLLVSAGATATLPEWQSALRSVAYTDTAITPSSGARTVSFFVTDSGNSDSNSPVRNVAVTAVDQTPIVTATGGSVDYLAGTAAIVIDGGIAVSDLDNATQASATASIGSGFHSGDSLGFVNTSSALFGNIIASYDAATGVMTMVSPGATATNSQWASALSSVTFSSTSTSFGSRTIGFSISDGTRTSAVATSGIDLLGLPKVTGVGSTTANGSYKTGDTITVTVVFDQVVTVSGGTPTLTLETGSSDHAATFASGSGSNTLAFSYTVQAGDASADLDYIAVSALALNGATIRGGGGVDAVLTLPVPGSAGSLGAQANLLVDGIAPVVVSVAVPANGTHVTGQALDFTVGYDGPVVVDTSGGTPSIDVTLATGTVSAAYLSGSGSNALLFRYTVAAGDLDSDGIALPAAIALNGGRVRDGAGNDALPALNGVPATTGVLVGLASQSIAFGAQAARSFEPGGTFVLDPLATASSGLAVAYTSQTTSVCTITGSTVTMLAAGTCTIAADQAGDADYDAASTVVQSFALGKGTQAITGLASDPAAPKFAPNGTFTVSATGGASGNPVVFATTTASTCSVAGDTVTMLAAGTCTLTADQAGNDDYGAAPRQTLDVQIARATPALAWIDGLQKIAGEAAFALTDPDSDSSGAFTFSSSDPAVATIDGHTVTIAGPGTATLVATQAATRDYEEASVSATLTVSARPDPTRDAEVRGTLQGQVDASVRFVSAQQVNIQGRLQQLRSGGGQAATNQLMLGYLGHGGGMSVPLGPQAGAGRVMPAGVWTAGTITVGRRDPGTDSGKLGFRSDGVTIGFDRAFGKHVLLGIAGGYGWSDTDTGDASTLDGRQRSMAAYGMWRGDGRAFVDGVAGFGNLDFDIARWSDPAGATARARRSGDQAFGALTFGYEHATDHMALTAYGRYDVSRTTLESYAESGLGIYDLRYGRQTVDDSGMALGVGAHHHFATKSVSYRPYWLLEYRDALHHRSDVGINYVVAPVASDYVMGLQGSFDDTLSVGAGVELGLPHGWQLALQFRHEQAGSNRAESYGLQLSRGNPGAMLPLSGLQDPMGPAMQWTGAPGAPWQGPAP